MDEQIVHPDELFQAPRLKLRPALRLRFRARAKLQVCHLTTQRVQGMRERQRWATRPQRPPATRSLHPHNAKKSRSGMPPENDSQDSQLVRGTAPPDPIPRFRTVPGVSPSLDRRLQWPNPRSEIAVLLLQRLSR